MAEDNRERIKTACPLTPELLKIIEALEYKVASLEERVDTLEGAG